MSKTPAPTSTPTSTPTPTPTSAPRTPIPKSFSPMPYVTLPPKHKSGLSKEAIAGIIVGSVTLLLIVAVSINSTKGGKKRGKRRGKKGRKK